MQSEAASSNAETYQVRKLEITDKNKGFMELLQQLTVCDPVSDEVFQKRFEELKSYGDDHIICVIEDVSRSKIVATGSVFIEKKFVRSCGKAGHIEDVVVDSSARGMQLGKKVIGYLADHARSIGCYKLSTSSSKPLHPLHEIAMTPTHKLLLKQWLKEEELILNRVALKETQIDSVQKELTHLYVFFFLFHSLSLILLFSSGSSSLTCNRSWVPSLCSLLCSLGLIWAVRYKTEVELHLEKMLKREKEDRNLLGKCVEELKKKGLDFDLLKEVDALRRAKSLKGENKSVTKWSGKDFVTMFFVAVSCFVLALTRVILCN